MVDARNHWRGRLPRRPQFEIALKCEERNISNRSPAPSVRIPMSANPQCNFVAAEFCAKRNRVEFAGIWHTKWRPLLPSNAPCTGFPRRTKIFASCDQSVVFAIPFAHDIFGKFRLRGLQPASRLRRCVLVFRHVNEGATCLGPDLEAECRRRVRGVRIRRRDFAGGILSSAVERQRYQQSR